jgi:hypothetical protein
MRNSVKANKYWIMKNSIFNKKYNLNEDLAQWEGWQIEARTLDPLKIRNIICIYLRRKYIPPYFSSFQNITIVLTEETPNFENYKINPKAYKLIELIANSIAYNVPVNNREYTLLLKAKVNSLLLDEESFYFFENSLNTIGVDVHRLGYEFLFGILHFLEHNLKDKELFGQLKKELDQKTSNYNEIIAEFNLDRLYLLN